MGLALGKSSGPLEIAIVSAILLTTWVALENVKRMSYAFEFFVPQLINAFTM